MLRAALRVEEQRPTGPNSCSWEVHTEAGLSAQRAKVVNTEPTHTAGGALTHMRELVILVWRGGFLLTLFGSIFFFYFAILILLIFVIVTAVDFLNVQIFQFFFFSSLYYHCFQIETVLISP